MESIKGVVVLVSLAILLGIGWNVQLRLPEARIDQPIKIFSKELPLKGIAAAVENPSFVDGALNGSVIWGKVFSSFLQNTWEILGDTVENYRHWRTGGRGVLVSLICASVFFICLMIVGVLLFFAFFFLLLWACVVMHASLGYYAGLFLACAFWLAFFYMLSREKQPPPTAGENAQAPEQSA
jgi:hypothetical protein